MEESRGLVHRAAKPACRTGHKNTNKATAQNPTFFEDLQRAFDRLKAEFNDCTVVLTGTGRVFSAGLDFDHHFPLFARRSTSEVDVGLRPIGRRTCASSLTRVRRWRRSTDMLTRAGLLLRSIVICALPRQAIFNSLSTRCRSAYRCLLFIAKSSSMQSALHQPTK